MRQSFLSWSPPVLAGCALLGVVCYPWPPHKVPLGQAARQLAAPPNASLPTISDRFTFIYVDFARVLQSDTGVEVHCQRRGKLKVVELPAAAGAVVLLGPGTSITAPAAIALSRAGTTIVVCGAEGARTHLWGPGLSSTPKWAYAQARLWTAEESREETAARLFLRRFLELPPEPHTLHRLRGLEGMRVKRVYKAHAERVGVPDWRRNYNPEHFKAADPINRALSVGNSCLYGLCLAAAVGIGALPQLGFLHSGTPMAFVHDIADLYKTETTIPVAFSCFDSPDPERKARRLIRDHFVDGKILKNAVRDIQWLLAPGLDKYDQVGIISDGGTIVPSGVNWSRIVGDGE